MKLISKSFPDEEGYNYAGYLSLDDNLVNCNVHHVYTSFSMGSGSNFHDVNPKKIYELHRLISIPSTKPSIKR